MVGEGAVLALVPARAGSKSIPRKNARDFAGHPLLAYSVAAGLQAQTVDRVIVTTDDTAMAAIGRDYGAEAPFLRPSELAADDTRDLPVFEHALRWLEEEEGYRPEIVVQLRPTSPLRPPDLVDRAVTLLRSDERADSARAIVPSGQNPYKMWRLGAEGRLEALLDDGPPEAYNRPRQELPPTYWQTGHIDAIRRRTILEKDSMSGDVILGLRVDPAYSVDIDSELDWARAEARALEGDLPFVDPAPRRRPLPDPVRLLILDFDGVLTDNRVWVNADGQEWIAANRSDGWGIGRVREAGIEVVVLSTETDPVVAARCEKLGIEAWQGFADKPPALERILEERGVPAGAAVFVGNDTNDVPCFPLVACALAPADAHPQVRRQADRVLKNKGGRGAVREVCDLLLAVEKRRELNA